MIVAMQGEDEATESLNGLTPGKDGTGGGTFDVIYGITDTGRRSA